MFMSMSTTLMMITTTIFLLFSLISSSSTSPPDRTSQISRRPPPPFKKIYAFGDSFTDTGNTASITGPNGFTHVSNLPYGKTYFHHPTNRYSDGRLVIDFIAQSLALPFLPPYLKKDADTSHGINYAVAGSTAIRHSFFVKNNLTLDITPQSLQTQLNWFQKTEVEAKGCKGATVTPNECKAVFGDALIWVGEIGANDYAYTVGSSVVSTKTIQQLGLRSVTGFLEVINSNCAPPLPSTANQLLPYPTHLPASNHQHEFSSIRPNYSLPFNFFFVL